MVDSLLPQTDPFEKEKPKVSEKSQEQINCEAKGGRWNGDRQLCEIPQAVAEQRSKDKAAGVPQESFKPLKSAQTGELSGFTTQEGSTFLGVSPQKVSEVATNEAFKQELPVGGQAEAVLEIQRQQLQDTGAGLATSVGATPSDAILDQLQSDVAAEGLNYFSALKSGVPGAIPDVITGATAGAGVGALGGTVVIPGIGTVAGAGGLAVVGAVAGGVKGFYSDFIRNLEQQQSAQIEGTIRTLSETKPTMNDIVNAQNANPENALANKRAFDNQMAFIDLAYEDLKDLTDSKLNDFLGDNGINQLKEFEVFYELDGERDRLVFDMQLALANPDPSRIRTDSITAADIKKRIEKELK